MKFLSVCSGIEAASQAWCPLGWEAVAFSEIEPFPCAVLAHHYPNVPNWGDMTKYQEWPDVPNLDVLCGGTPCQSFSVAGLRKGLADPRGNLMLTFGAIAAKYRPRWLVWENVPGVLSSNGGRDFGSFLGLLGELGYGFAYRVLDAQYVRVESHPRAVPQRRRRVFVVGYLGDWRRAAAVLFERESLSGHPAPSRKARERVAPTLSARTQGGGGLGTDFDCDGGLVHAIQAGALRESPDSGPDGVGVQSGIAYTLEARAEVQPVSLQAFGGNNTSGAIDVATARSAHASASGRMDFESETFLVAHALRADGFDASEDGTGRGTPLVAVGVDSYNGALTGDAAATMGTRGSSETASGPQVMTLAIRGRGDSHDLEFRTDGSANAVLTPNGGRAGIGVGAIAFDCKSSGQNGFGVRVEVAGTQRAMAHADSHTNGGGHQAVMTAMQVRRLTPLETERLMGMEDGYSAITYRGKVAADGPRYKSHGNSWAINCVRWIGERMELVDALTCPP